MSPQLQTEFLTLAILVLIVARFLVRELRARTVRISRLWIRPAFLIVIAAGLIWGTLAAPSTSHALLVPSVVVGAVVGLIVGALVTASTRVEPVGGPGFVRLRGSWATVAIWIGALALRMLARFLAGGPASADSLAVNCGTVMLVAVAFTTFAALIAPRAKAIAEP